ncbi:MAG: hypothetical protein ACE5EC_10120, partial [Phycisphaerae bacterium]
MYRNLSTSHMIILIVSCGLLPHVGCGRSFFTQAACPPGGVIVDLNGFWRDGGKSGLVLFNFVQDGIVITSTREKPAVCDHQDGLETMTEFTEDFVGQIDGCDISGQITACQFGLRDPSRIGLNGVIKATLEAEISHDQQRIMGSFTNPATGRSGTAVWERLDCRPKVPGDYLLPGNEVIKFETEHDLDMGIITYQGDSNSGIEILRRVVAGVSGAVATLSPATADTPIVIGVIVGNGNRLEYSLFGQAAIARVSPGDAVTPDTEIGTIAEPAGQPDHFMLRLQAFEAMTDAP